MIVRPRANIFKLFFVMHGSIVPRIIPHILGFAAYAAAIVLVVRTLGLEMGEFNVAPFGLIGVTLSIYLSFRNSAAYDRWWEARKLWGQMVYEVRNLARAAIALTDDATQHRPLLMNVLAFCHLLRGHLRRVDASVDARRFVGEEMDGIAAFPNKPDAAMRGMGNKIAALRKAGAIDTIGFRILDERLAALSAVQAGCERIAGTPLPFAYTLLLQRTAYIFCLLLPIGLVGVAGWATPFFIAFVAYTFFGLDALSEELEDPFGIEPNDLALDGLCRVCEISVMDALGEPAPSILAAKNFNFS